VPPNSASSLTGGVRLKWDIRADFDDPELNGDEEG
jgi:hypothetical protein